MNRGWMEGQMDGRTDGWMDEQTCGRTDGLIDRLMIGWQKGGWMLKYTLLIDNDVYR